MRLQAHPPVWAFECLGPSVPLELEPTRGGLIIQCGRYNKITTVEFENGGYLGIKICSHIDMDAMKADKKYSKWFAGGGFELDKDIGLYGQTRFKSRGKDHSTPPPRPAKRINSRWDAMAFYINPDFKFRQFELPRGEIPYTVQIEL